MVKVDDDLQQIGDLDGSPLRIRCKMVAVGIERGLVDLPQITGAVPGSDELEEAARPIEQLADAGRRQTVAVSRNIEVEPRVEELHERAFNASFRDAVEVHCDVADACVLAEHGRRQIPGAVLEARQRRALVPAPQRSTLQHRLASKGMRLLGRNELQGRRLAHVRASSGR